MQLTELTQSNTHHNFIPYTEHKTLLYDVQRVQFDDFTN